MKPELYIARRYLFARKSLGVIHTISAISAIGMAVGTAALILILSVFNGFDRVIQENLSDLAPDVLVTAAHGKYFAPPAPLFDALADDPDVVRTCDVLEEQVFVAYAGREGLARAKGVDGTYEQESGLAAHTVDGEFSLHRGDVAQAALGSGLAYKLGVRPHFTDPLILYYPRRGTRIPLAGPASALGSVRVSPSCLLSVGAAVDEELLVLPIAQMRTLLGLGEEVSGVEITLSGGPDRRTVRRIREMLGADYIVRDRYQQNPALYKMMRYEKLAVYLILLFVVIIIATNIFGSLSMLVIEKEEDTRTLRALGADDRLIRRIFIWEGWLVSLSGLLAGLLAGIGLALLQERFGIIKMPGGFLLQAYPVVLQAGDVLWTVLGVAAVGMLISLLAAPKATSSQSPAPGRDPQ